MREFKKHWSDSEHIIVKFENFSKEEFEQLEKIAEKQGNGGELDMQIESIVLEYLEANS